MLSKNCLAAAHPSLAALLALSCIVTAGFTQEKQSSGEIKDTAIGTSESQPVSAAEPAVAPGIVSGPTFGLSTRFPLGTTQPNQSAWGLEARFLMPTIAQSQLRITAGLPAAPSKMESDFASSSYRLPYVAVEHEWGYRIVNVSAGIAYMYMSGFSRPASDSNPYQLNYKATQAFNWAFGVRVGSGSKGFRGRITWPMPFAADYNNLKNYFFEYSAIGMFGNEKFKAGVGIQGLYKQQRPDNLADFYRTMNANLAYYYNVYSDSSLYDIRSVNCMIPVGKFAFLVGERTTITASVDLGALFIPTQVPDSSTDVWWDRAPTFSLGVVYSLAPLKSINSFDGTF